MSEKSDNAITEQALLSANETIAQLEAELDDVNRRLIKAEGGKSYFISHALNELNNPLAAIIGLTEQVMSMQQPAWDHVKQSLQWVHDESSYLEFQLKNVFVAGELEAGVAKVNAARVDIYSILNSVTNRYLALAQRKGVSIQSNGGHALLSIAGATRYFNVDGALLSLVYSNLLDNAVKFSPAGSEVRIQVDMSDAGLDISVEDDGPGISDDEKVNVFDRFWQGDNSTTKLFRGLGLGLSVATRSAELLGGRLQLAQNYEAGARFEVHLPMLNADQFVDTPDENVFFFAGDEDIDSDNNEVF